MNAPWLQYFTGFAGVAEVHDAGLCGLSWGEPHHPIQSQLYLRLRGGCGAPPGPAKSWFSHGCGDCGVPSMCGPCGGTSTLGQSSQTKKNSTARHHHAFAIAATGGPSTVNATSPRPPSGSSIGRYTYENLIDGMASVGRNCHLHSSL